MRNSYIGSLRWFRIVMQANSSWYCRDDNSSLVPYPVQPSFEDEWFQGEDIIAPQKIFELRLNSFFIVSRTLPRNLKFVNY